MGFKFVPKVYRVRVANKRFVECEGYINATFKIHNRVHTFPLILMHNTIQPVILGLDYQTWSGLHPVFTKNEWYWEDKPNEVFPLQRKPSLDIAFLDLSGIDESADEFCASDEDIRNKINENQVLTAEQKEELYQLLIKYRHVFSSRVGKVNYVFDIDTGDHPPIKQKPFTQSHFKELQMREHVDNMVKQGIIEPTEVTWASSAFIIPKKGGLTRMVINYVPLNKVTKKLTFPTPNIDTLVSRGKDCQFLTSFDMKDAYWHVQMTERAKERAAFVTPFGSYKPNRLQFGLVNAPAAFCGVITRMFDPLRPLGVACFFDDISAINKEWKEHLKAIEGCLETMSNEGIRVNLNKTNFCAKELDLLGYKVTTEGVKPQDKKRELLEQFPRPTSIKSLRRLLGLSGWFRRFIMYYSRICSPLYEVLKGKNPKFFWTSKQEDAFQKIKNALNSAPILAAPDYELPWEVWTDASFNCIGSILCQRDPETNKLRTIDMISRRLTVGETRLSVCEKELLAITYSLKKWRRYVEGAKILVHTDSKSLAILAKCKNPVGRMARWLVCLSQLDATLCFVPGTQNKMADLLSRLAEDEKDYQPISNPILMPATDEKSQQPYFVFNNDCLCNQMSQIQAEQLTIDEIGKATVEDKFTSALLHILKGEKDQAILDSPAVRRFVKRYENCSIVTDNVIYVDVNKNVLKQPNLKILVPKALRQNIMSLVHDVTTAGHSGVYRTLKRLYRTYTWPKASKNVTSYVRTCKVCQQHKADQGRKAPMIVTEQSTRFDTIYVDLKGPLVRSSTGYQFILVAIDGFSHWVELVALRKSDAKTIATALINDVFAHHNIPRRIYMDNVSYFRGHTLDQMCKQWGIKPKFITVFRPQSNLAERVNKELTKMLAMYVNSEGKSHRSWPECLKHLQIVLNSSIDKVTGFTPSMLAHGFEFNLPEVPIPRAIPSKVDLPLAVLNTTARWRKIVSKVIARRQAEKEHRMAKINEFRTREELNEGDYVMVKTHYKSEKSRYKASKLYPRFEGRYEVVKIINPVTYQLKDTATGVIDKFYHHLSNLKKIDESARWETDSIEY